MKFSQEVVGRCENIANNILKSETVETPDQYAEAVGVAFVLRRKLAPSSANITQIEQNVGRLKRLVAILSQCDNGWNMRGLSGTCPKDIIKTINAGYSAAARTALDGAVESVLTSAGVLV